ILVTPLHPAVPLFPANEDGDGIALEEVAPGPLSALGPRVMDFRADAQLGEPLVDLLGVDARQEHEEVGEFRPGAARLRAAEEGLNALAPGVDAGFPLGML